jgi:hypothetical protein
MVLHRVLLVPKPGMSLSLSVSHSVPISTGGVVSGDAGYVSNIIIAQYIYYIYINKCSSTIRGYGAGVEF